MSLHISYARRKLFRPPAMRPVSRFNEPELPLPHPRLGDRSLFPTLEEGVYLNHAAVSPLSRPVREAAEEALADFAATGLGAVGPWMRRREVLRADVAAFLGVQPEDIGFAPGTTRGIVDIALAVDWRPGDRIIVFDGEFPSNVGPWMTAARRFGATVERLPLEGFGDGSGRGLARLEEALARPGVRLVAVSAVQFATGLRMPLGAMGELAHARGAELFADGVQAVGALPVDLTHVDYLVAGAHKWLMSVDGIAVVYAAPAARERLTPLTGGWLSVPEPLDFLIAPCAPLDYDKPVRRSMDWVEGGVQTTAAHAGLHASVGLLAELGPARIAAHVQRLHDLLEPGLQALGYVSARAADPQARSGTLSVRPPPGASLEDVAARWMSAGVSISTPDGWLRLSPHWPNSEAEVARVLEVASAALRARP